MIEYRDTHDFTEQELERLFLSVEWSSGHFPEKLKVAMQNFRTVYSAWDGEKLIGMICAMDDGIMNAYVHYLLVDPEYHGQTVGRTLVDMMKEHYKWDGIVAAICAAPGLVASQLEGLEGKKFTCYDGFEEKMLAKGAVYVKAPVVTDGKLITGRSAAYAIDFGLAILEKMRGPEKAAEVKAALLL